MRVIILILLVVGCSNPYSHTKTQVYTVKTFVICPKGAEIRHEYDKRCDSLRIHPTCMDSGIIGLRFRVGNLFNAYGDSLSALQDTFSVQAYTHTGNNVEGLESLARPLDGVARFCVYKDSAIIEPLGVHYRTNWKKRVKITYKLLM